MRRAIVGGGAIARTSTQFSQEFRLMQADGKASCRISWDSRTEARHFHDNLVIGLLCKPALYSQVAIKPARVPLAGEGKTAIYWEPDFEVGAATGSGYPVLHWYDEVKGSVESDKWRLKLKLIAQAVNEGRMLAVRICRYSRKGVEYEWILPKS